MAIKTNKRLSAPPNPERGATLVLMAILLVVLLGFVAMVVDVALLFVNRNEIQNVADGSSLAATRTLGHIYQGLTGEQQQSFHCDPGPTCAGLIRQAAYDVAVKNRAGRAEMSLLEDDVIIGQWDGLTGTFQPGLYNPDAVRVIARRDETVPNGPIRTFFAGLLGVEEVPVTAEAIAALTGQGKVKEGDLELPVTLSDWFFQDGNFCNDHIRFNPSNDPTSCGGWTTYFLGGNDPNLEDLLNEETENPDLDANESVITMNGGNIVAAFPELLMQFQRRGCATSSGDTPAERTYLTDVNGEDVNSDGCIDWEEVQNHEGRVVWTEEDNQGVDVPTHYPDPDQPTQDDPTRPRYYHMWETTVPIYQRDDCSNPNQEEMVVGFTTVIITDVNQSTQQIDGMVVCNRVSPEDNRGGGGEYGLKGSIPGLVR